MIGTKEFALGLGLAGREIKGRYEESALGMLWAFLSPIFLIVIYAFFFGKVMGMEKHGRGPGGFALYLFAGYLAWDLFGRMLGEGPDILLGNRTILTKVKIPMESVFLARMFFHVFHWAFSTVVLVAAILLHGRSLNWTFLYLAPLVAGLSLFSLGCTMFVAVVGLFLKDFKEMVGILLVAWLFATPLFYYYDSIPALQGGTLWGTVYRLNPLYWYVSFFRDCTLYGRTPPLGPFCLALLGSSLVFLAGKWWLGRSKSMILDIL